MSTISTNIKFISTKPLQISKEVCPSKLSQTWHITEFLPESANQRFTQNPYLPQNIIEDCKIPLTRTLRLCPHCWSYNLQTLAWIKPNHNNELVQLNGSNPAFCENCNDYTAPYEELTTIEIPNLPLDNLDWILEHYTLADGWINCYTEFDNNIENPTESPLTFANPQSAKIILDDFFQNSLPFKECDTHGNDSNLCPADDCLNLRFNDVATVEAEREQYRLNVAEKAI